METIFFGGGFAYTGSRNIVRWDGTNDYGVGGGINGGLAFVSSMVVFMGELYVAGYFTIADGNAGNHIMKWNGSNWSDVGGGLDNWVNDMKVYHNQLYVAGVFDHAGGIPASRIARWDGTSWHALGTEIFDGIIASIEFYHNELYVAGGFHYIDTVNAKFLAKYNGILPSDIKETKNSFSISSYPNPSTTNVSIKYNLMTEDRELIAYNIVGEAVCTWKLPAQTNQITLDISKLAQGAYFCRLQTEKGVAVSKFIKQ